MAVSTNICDKYKVENKNKEQVASRQINLKAKASTASWYVCFVALHPKSTAMVMAGRSVHLSTVFPGQA